MSNSNTEVIERLDILIALMIPPYAPASYPITGLAADVLRYCDAQHTVDEIVAKLGKPKNTVEVALSKLRSLGLMRSVVKNSKVYYVRLV